MSVWTVILIIAVIAAIILGVLYFALALVLSSKFI